MYEIDLLRMSEVTICFMSEASRGIYDSLSEVSDELISLYDLMISFLLSGA